MKDKVYSERIESLEHLKKRIQHAIISIGTATLSNVLRNINTRINYVVHQEVKHIEQSKFYVKLNKIS